MIQISKEEAKIIREQFPNMSLKKTVNKYYVEERPAIMRLLGRDSRKEVKRYC